MDKRLITLKEFTKEVDYKASRMFEEYTVPIEISGNAILEPKYEFYMIKGFSDAYLDKYIKPAVSDKLKKQGVVFKKSVIVDGDIDRALKEKDGDTLIIIYKSAERIFKDYNLIGKNLFAQMLEEKEGLYIKTAYNRVKQVIKRYNIKPVAYNKTALPVYDFENLKVAYNEHYNNC